MVEQDVGLIGLAVMGQNLGLNIERNGFKIAVYNRTGSTTQAFIECRATGKKIVPAYEIGTLMRILRRPRVIMLMIKAGPAIDQVIEDLKPYLDPGDLIIDGGNSFYKDTERRYEYLAKLGVDYLGIGISGGEEGALWGPSIMPGGSRKAYETVEPILSAIAAKAPDGKQCVTYIGPRGAGHYVKMVHNGIEYSDMQLIAESYDLMHRGLGLTAEELQQVYADWNGGELESYLIEITHDIFAKKDEETGRPLVELILDASQQKGTGKWTVQDALDLDAPTPTISAAVEARIISVYKEERVAVSEHLRGPTPSITGDPSIFIDLLRNALYAAKICSYAQGYSLLRLASLEYKYELNLGDIASIWRGGCIIRARFLDDIRKVFEDNPNLPNLLMDPVLGKIVQDRQDSVRRVVQLAAGNGIPVPAFYSALAYFDSYRSARLPANLTQAQRDYFGAHTYRRIDKQGTFHTDWTK